MADASSAPAPSAAEKALHSFHDMTKEFVEWLMSSFRTCKATQAWGQLFLDSSARKEGQDWIDWMHRLCETYYEGVAPLWGRVQARDASVIRELNVDIVREVQLADKYAFGFPKEQEEAMRDSFWIYIRALYKVANKYRKAIGGTARDEPPSSASLPFASLTRAPSPLPAAQHDAHEAGAVRAKAAVNVAARMFKAARAQLPEDKRKDPRVADAFRQFLTAASDVEAETEAQAVRALLPVSVSVAQQLAEIAAEGEGEGAAEGAADDISWLHGSGGLATVAQSEQAGGMGGVLAKVMRASVNADELDDVDEEKMAPEDYLTFLEKATSQDMGGIRDIIKDMPPEVMSKIGEMQKSMVKDLKSMSKEGKSLMGIGAEIMRRMETAPKEFRGKFSDDEFKRANASVSVDAEKMRKLMQSYEGLKKIPAFGPHLSAEHLVRTAMQNAAALSKES